jgi:hypothetical protein
LRVLILMIGCVLSARADQESAAGIWRWEEGQEQKAWVLIIDRGGVFDGFVVKTFPAIGKRASKAAEQPLLKSLRRDGLTYKGGTFTDPRDGKVYQVAAVLTADGNNLAIRRDFGPPVAILQRLPERALADIPPASDKLSPADAAAINALRLDPRDIVETTTIQQALAALEAERRRAAEQRAELNYPDSSRPAPTVSPLSPPGPAPAASPLSPPVPTASPTPATSPSPTVADDAERKRIAEKVEADRQAQERLAKLQAEEAERKQAAERVAANNDAACRERMRKLGVVQSNGPCVDVSDIVANLMEGDYTFNDPKKAYLLDPFTLRLVLKTSDKENVSDRFVNLPGAVTTKQGKFAQSLEATLRGDDFVIEPSGPIARTATRAEPVEWEWKVTAQSAGKKTLTVEVAANIQIGSDKSRVQIKTLSALLEIQVSTFYRVKAYLAEANGFVLAAGAAIPALLAIFGLVPKARSGVASIWNWLSRKTKRNRATRRADVARARRSR